MSVRLFLGNLPYHLTSQDLSVWLGNCGHSPLFVKVISDRDTGQSKGFAFAEFGSREIADDAIANLRGQLIHGRPLRIDEAVAPSRGRLEDRGQESRNFDRPPSRPPSSRSPMPYAEVWQNDSSRPRGGDSRFGNRDRDRSRNRNRY